MFNIDRVIALVGLGTTFVIYFTQGPYDAKWKYIFPTLPLIAAILIIVVYRVIVKME